MKNIVILGASGAGVSTAHRLLKQSAKAGVAIKVTLVSPNSHLYWNIAITRAIVPGAIEEDKLFFSINDGFKQYTADKFEFILATAEALDVEGKKVTVSGQNGRTDLSYDYLVLATGSRTKEDTPFKGHGSHQATLDALHDYQNKVKSAGSITVVGAGATGVETAGELGYAYGSSKKITLVCKPTISIISSHATVLDGTPASVSKTATKQLQNLSVTIKTSTKVSGSAQTPDGRWELTLSDGSKMTTDLYIPTMGIVPNSSFVPEKYLNPAGFVIVDEFLRVKGTTDVYAAGDISAVERAQYGHMDKQSAHVAKNLGLVLKGAEQVKYKPDPKDMLAVPVGKKVGTGHMGSIRLPSFLVNMVKGKTLFTDKVPGVITGSNF
ncbi:amid-like mitochondrial oxidoreductase protein [Rutstroemia sp. NJR-2017a WRK4]|nr:amid-like mitochondrial oxidoreductase protein [Rutstroemia sp. NJR-2017a WRK4]